VWTPVIAEYLDCAREEGNPEDRYTVAVIKHDTIFSHLPRAMSTIAHCLLDVVAVYGVRYRRLSLL